MEPDELEGTMTPDSRLHNLSLFKVESLSITRFTDGDKRTTVTQKYVAATDIKKVMKAFPDAWQVSAINWPLLLLKEEHRDPEFAGEPVYGYELYGFNDENSPAKVVCGFNANEVLGICEKFKTGSWTNIRTMLSDNERVTIAIL